MPVPDGFLAGGLLADSGQGQRYFDEAFSGLGQKLYSECYLEPQRRKGREVF